MFKIIVMKPDSNGVVTWNNYVVDFLLKHRHFVFWACQKCYDKIAPFFSLGSAKSVTTKPSIHPTGPAKNVKTTSFCFLFLGPAKSVNTKSSFFVVPAKFLTHFLSVDNKMLVLPWVSIKNKKPQGFSSQGFQQYVFSMLPIIVESFPPSADVKTEPVLLEWSCSLSKV